MTKCSASEPSSQGRDEDGNNVIVTRHDGPLRVLRVIARMNVGGPAAQASVLATGLDPARFESRLLAGAPDAHEAEYTELRAPGVPLEKVRGLGRAVRPLDDARALRALATELHRFRPHIVHTHTAKAGALGRITALTARVPARVHTFHGHLLHGYFSPLETRAVIQAERVLARVTTRTVAVGARVRDELLAAKIGRPEQYTIVPPGVDLRPLPNRRAARERLGLTPEEPVIAYVGRLIPVKRPDRLMQVAAALTRRFPTATMLVVGDGQLRQQTESQAAASGATVHFLGWRSDVETIYAAADVVVITSDNEGMPVSLIEAALAGRPAVTTAVGSAAEVVVDGETGFVTDTSTQSVANGIERLLLDAELRERMGETARTRAQQEFSAQRLIRDTENLYEEVVAETRALERR